MKSLDLENEEFQAVKWHSYEEEESAPHTKM